MHTDYGSHSASDFAADDFFQSWVFGSDADTERFWRLFVQQNPHKADAVAEARAMLLHLGQDTDAPPAGRKQAVWQRIEAELAGERERAPAPRTSTLPGWQWAASVAAMLLLVAGYLLLFPPSDATRYATGPGEKRVVILPDSSEVILNARSSLQLAGAWNRRESREVWLEGEAYFKVRKKKGFGNARFIVHTKDLNVEVLGTSFNVKTRKESTQVVLTEGKVKIDPLHQPEPQAVYMAPGESVVVQEERKITKTTVNPELYSAWKSDELVLNKTSLREIGNFVEQTYGLTVRYENDSLPDLVLDGTALPTDNRDYFLRAVSVALDLEVVVDGQQVTFRPRTR
jgi:ferric-dicitrate binding protein FerR (iron transport regulator)